MREPPMPIKAENESGAGFCREAIGKVFSFFPNLAIGERGETWYNEPFGFAGQPNEEGWEMNDAYYAV